MIQILLSIAPVFLLIMLGLAIRQTRFLPDHFWPSAERFLYYIMMPALIISLLADAELAALAVAPMVAAIGLSLVTLTAITLPAAPLLKLVAGVSGPTFTSIFQGAIRNNVFISLALGEALFGREGTTLMVLAVAISVPYVNVMSVIVLLFHASGSNDGEEKQRSRSAVILGSLRQLLSNPLILAVGIGLLLNISGIGLVPVIGPMLEVLGRGVLPIALVAVGAGLTLAAVNDARLAMAVASAAKLLILPAITWAFCLAAGLDPLTTAIATIFHAVPAASSSYILARQMGGDEGAMAGIITIQTAISVVTLPLVGIAVAAL